MSQPKRLRAGLIGCGFISRRHGPAWHSSPDAELVAVCDQELDRARGRAAEWGVERVYADAAEMLDRERPHVVDIVTTPESHSALVAVAAERGIHVLCQKPLAPTLAEATAMVDLCDRAGVRFMVMEMARYSSWMMEMGERLRAGDIGRPHYLRTIQRRQLYRHPNEVFEVQPYLWTQRTLIIYEAMIHAIDCSRFLLGEIESVYARATSSTPGIVGEDWALVVCGHLGGATSSHDGTWVTPGGPPGPQGTGQTVLEGSHGVLSFFRSDGELRLTTLNDSRVLSSHPGGVGGSRAFEACIGHFAAAVRTGTPFKSSARDNLLTLAATLASYDSLATGQAIRLT